MKYEVSITRLATAILLFIGSWLMFSQIKSCNYFSPTPTAGHIIDSHLQPDSTDKSFKIYSKRFFDEEYVKEAAKSYSPGRYMRSFFILDLFFPFIYGFLFMTLAAYWKPSAFYNALRIAIVACMVFDLLENTSFAYYLYYQDGNMNGFVALCTTIKSILFASCMVISGVTIVILMVRMLKSRMKG